jgi:hypothetical protein
MMSPETEDSQLLLNLIECKPRRGPGRPAIYFDEKHERRRTRERAMRHRRMADPTAVKRPRGRPRSEFAKNPAAALRHRVKRVHTRVADISIEAASKANELKERHGESWNEAFGVGHFISAVRKVAAAQDGPTLLPGMAEHEATLQMFEEVGRGSCEMIKSCIGGGAKSSVTRLASEYVTDISLFAKQIDSTAAYVKRARKDFTIARCLVLNYDLQGQFTHYHRTSEIQLIKVMECFFLRNSNVRSGQRDNVRTSFRELPMKLQDIQQLWYIEFPSYCREAASTWPEWYLQISSKTSPNKWQASVIASVATASADVEAELRQRRIEAKTIYHMYLRDNRMRANEASVCNSVERAERFETKRRAFEKAELDKLRLLDSSGVANTADGSLYPVDGELHVSKIKPPTMKYFFQEIKQLGYSWSQNVYPTECPIHDEGPRTLLKLEKAKEDIQAIMTGWEKAKAELIGQASDANSAREQEARFKYAASLKELRALQAAQALYVRHLEQYKVCREVIKRIEEHLKPGEAVLYRDFVAQYMSGGAKLSNLVFVILWHDGVRVQKFNKVMKFNHFCADKDTRSQDAYYMADVWRWFLLGGEGSSNFLKRNKIHTLYVSGDHGPHFSSISTMYNESTFYELYSIRLFNFFLCSYHAFNRCDGAGVESKQIHAGLMRTREALPLSIDVSDQLNLSEYHNSVGVPFDKIDRGINIFSVKLAEKESLDLRGKCEVKYEWTNVDGEIERETGVILCRDVPAYPGEGLPYNVYDLRADPPGGHLCRLCSKEVQRPVRHKDTNGASIGCPRAADMERDCTAEKAQCIDDGHPQASRLSGSGKQFDKTALANMKKPMGSHPCRFDGCIGFHYYNQRSACNNHMREAHGLADGDGRIYVKEAKSRRASSAGQKQSVKRCARKRAPSPTSSSHPGPESMPAGCAPAPAPANSSSHPGPESMPSGCVPEPAPAPILSEAEEYKQMCDAQRAVVAAGLAALVEKCASNDMLPQPQPKSPATIAGEDSSDAAYVDEPELASGCCDHVPGNPVQLRRQSMPVNYKEHTSASDCDDAMEDESAAESSSEASGDAINATPSSVSSSSTCSSHSDSYLGSAKNQGKYVLYVIHNPQRAGERVDPKPTFFMLGLIDKPPEWEQGNLYFHTQDMVCTQDSSWPLSLNDGMFHVTRKTPNTAPNWINLCDPHSRILTVFPTSGLTLRGRLKEHVRKQALAALNGYKHVNFIAAWLAKVEADRPINPATHAPKRIKRS